MLVSVIAFTEFIKGAALGVWAKAELNMKYSAAIENKFFISIDKLNFIKTKNYLENLI
jgi:hypothetical protein